MTHKIFILTAAILTLFLFPRLIAAQHFSSTDFNIDWGNFNLTSGTKASTDYNLSDTVGQNAPGQYNSGDFIIKSGFQYAYVQQTQLSFSINSLSVALGTLVPGVASTATNIITISTPTGHGYDILASENHALAKTSSVFIPDTGCDVGATCTESATGTWSNIATYGFGFNALGINSSGVYTGLGTSSIFPNATSFRPFANVQAGKIPQIIMSESLPVSAHSARISYKANISGIQTAGKYENDIIFTAIPKY